MILSFSMKGIDFEFQILHVSIEYPLIEFEFEDVQALHHFESIIKDFNDHAENKQIETNYDHEKSIKFPLEFVDGLDLEIEE